MGTIQQFAAALWLWGRHGDPQERLMLSHAPDTVSQHLQGVSPTVIFSPWPIIGPGLWHIGRADGQEGHFFMSVKLEGACGVLGRIAQVCWPLGKEGSRLCPRRTQRAPGTSGTSEWLAGVTHWGHLSNWWHSPGAWTDCSTSLGLLWVCREGSPGKGDAQRGPCQRAPSGI